MSECRQRTLQEEAERLSSQEECVLEVLLLLLQLACCFAFSILLLGWLLAPELQQTYRVMDGNLEDRVSIV